jgi:hypothetical protein
MMGIKERNSHTLPEDICLEVAFGVPRVLRVDRAGVRGGWAGAGRGAVLRCHQGGRQCLVGLVRPEVLRSLQVAHLTDRSPNRGVFRQADKLRRLL